MPPRLNLLNFTRSIPYRAKAQTQWLPCPVAQFAPTQARTYSDVKAPQEPPAADRSKRLDAQPLPHVSEEAAQMAEITGGEGPDLSQATPVEEVVKGDKEAEEKLPKIMQDQLKSKSSSAPKGSRSYSTSTTPIGGGSSAFDMGLMGFKSPPAAAAPTVPGLKFDMPALPLPKDGHVKHRYDPVVDQVTNLLMRHGRKSVAQRNMALILQQLRTAPVPTINPQRPLLPGAPPPSHLPLNPVLYLTLAIDSVAPLLRIRSQRGAAGGGVALQIPVPLGQRQRRRIAIQWILGSASKRRTNVSGKTAYAQRVASELIAVVEGRSAVWERRNAVHKLGVSARSNIVLPRKK
ncbi:30S ribosomal protein-like protein S7 [Bimuria novae-zelandiae CBS 107.79]|uniref:Small ribosomal subunit protein uS7m n=1 Tax=Bimuria novae-zelandiae CBS 107.79 TaxID=1447943 RepID=A0A6A5UXH1_9PLEO|nr:30S ribosomal protein-like protein S7 [Bimuria novae-zelandiae CBS 107.79]